MKRIVIAFAIVTSLIFSACKGNPQEAVGANDKGDTTAFNKANSPNGSPDTVSDDSMNKNTGPGSETHAVDSEDKSKHR